MKSTRWWRSLSLSERLALAAWAAAAGAAALLPRAGVPDDFTLCLLRAVTELRCPGCGMGHAVLEALRGHLASSWAWHPLGPFLALVWTWWVARGLLNISLIRPFSSGIPRPEPAVGWGLVFAVLCVHALRVL